MPMRSGKPHRTWPQRLIITGNLCVIIVALVVAGSLGYLNNKLADVKRLALSGALTTPDAAPGAPQNFLIVGTDSDLGLSSNDPALQGRADITGARSDTIMILHVDPKKHAASLLSLQRDLWVEIAGQGISQKINSALGLGGEGTAGPATLIKTIEQNFEIPINHYVEIDFAGFEGVVKAVGGIPIYFNTGIRDFDPSDGLAHTSINVPGPGCVMLDPQQALGYARSRHMQDQAVPGDPSTWTDDNGNDYGRIQRQQDFVRRVLKRAIDKGIRDPLVMNSLVNSGIKSVRVDTGLSAGDVVALGRTFRSFNPEELQTVQLPVYGTYIGAAAVVLPKMPEAEAVLSQFRNVATSADEAVRSISVNVQNGTGRYNEATKVSDALGKVGFTTGPPGDNLGITGEASIIRYHAGQEAQARLLARHLKSDVIFELSTSNGSSTTAEPLTLITGTSYAGVLEQARSAASVPGPSTTAPTTTAPGTSTTTMPGASTTTDPGDVSTSTTSTVPGYLPGPPPPGVHCG
jgi:LCP family protein required for cell wall assembly